DGAFECQYVGHQPAQDCLEAALESRVAAIFPGKRAIRGPAARPSSRLTGLTTPLCSTPALERCGDLHARLRSQDIEATERFFLVLEVGRGQLLVHESALEEVQRGLADDDLTSGGYPAQ